jgi:Integrase core domain
MSSIPLTRQQLYDRAWTTPLDALAKELGLSGRGLGKLCDRHDIPVPPRGWWAKKAAGHRVRQTPLPTASGGMATSIRFSVITPQANEYRERFTGTARRVCLDWMIPLPEEHLRWLLAEWIPHYNGERSHSALTSGLPDKPTGRATLTARSLPSAHRVVASARLGGLHHHYRFESVAA